MDYQQRAQNNILLAAKAAKADASNLDAGSDTTQKSTQGPQTSAGGEVRTNGH